MRPLTVKREVEAILECSLLMLRIAEPVAESLFHGSMRQQTTEYVINFPIPDLWSRARGLNGKCRSRTRLIHSQR